MADQTKIQEYYQRLLDQAEEQRKKQEEERKEKLYEEDVSKQNYARWATREEFCRDLKPTLIHSEEKPDRAGVSLFHEEETAYMDTTDSHTLIIGSSGSKKTRLVILPTILNLMRAGESMVVTDPKAELFERTSKKLKDEGYKVYCVNFRDDSVMNCWNPLSIPGEFYTKGKFDLAIGLISDFASITIQEDPRGGLDPFWDNMARAAFMAMQLLMFGLSEKKEEINIRGILNLRNTLLMDREKMQGMYKLLDPNSILASYYASFYMLPEKTYGSVLATLDTHLQKFIIRPTLTDMLCRNDVNLHELGREKTAVFLVMPDEKETYHGLVSLFIQQCYEALIYDAQQYAKKTLPVRVNFLLDEFASLPEMKEFPSMIAAARSRNIRYDIVIQSEKQLTAKYGHHGETIKGNCNNWIYLYSREWDTLESLSRLCGEQKSGKPLVTPSRLQRLNKDEGEALIIHGREYPFLSHLADISEYDGEEFEEPYYDRIEHEGVPFFDYSDVCEAHSEEWIRAKLSNEKERAEQVAREDEENVRSRLLKLKKDKEAEIEALTKKHEQLLQNAVAEERKKWEHLLEQKKKTEVSLGMVWKEESLLLSVMKEQERTITDELCSEGSKKDAEKDGHTECVFTVEKLQTGETEIPGLLYDDGAVGFSCPKGGVNKKLPSTVLPLITAVNHSNMIFTVPANEEGKSLAAKYAKKLFLGMAGYGTKIPILVDCSKYDPTWNRFFDARKKSAKAENSLAVLSHILWQDELPDLSMIPDARELLIESSKETEETRKKEREMLGEIAYTEQHQEHISELMKAFYIKNQEEVPEYTLILYNLEYPEHLQEMGQFTAALMGLSNVQVIAIASTGFQWEHNFTTEILQMTFDLAKQQNQSVFRAIEWATLFFSEKSNQVVAKQNPLPSVRIHLEDAE